MAALGLGVSDQFVPFQDSTRVLLKPLRVFSEEPTAVHAAAETQDMPSRELLVPGAPRWGLGTADHPVPFQDSIGT